MFNSWYWLNKLQHLHELDYLYSYWRIIFINMEKSHNVFYSCAYNKIYFRRFKGKNN